MVESGGRLSATHTYRKSAMDGESQRAFNVRVTVADDDDNETTHIRPVLVTNQAPTGHAGGPYVAQVDVLVELIGTGVDPDGSITAYEWDFDGDGAFDWLSPTTGTTAHSYATQGDYTAVFRVTDSDTNMVAESAEVTVTDSALTVDAGGPYSAEVGQGVMFAGGATDPGRIVVRFEWDFEGDGTFDWSSTTTGHTSHAYESPGEYVAILRVTDDNANAYTDSARVTVAGGALPVADAGGPYTVGIYAELELLGSASDPDGEIVYYEWDFDGDGTYDWSSPTTGVATHTYLATGIYGAVLRVTDDSDNVVTVLAEVAVTNLPPVADAGEDIIARYVDPIELFGAGSGGAGGIVLYQWDFEGDGTLDWSSGTSGYASHLFSTAGTYAAVLWVRDIDGNTSTDTVLVMAVNSHLETLGIERAITGHTNWVRSVDVTSNGVYIVSGGQDSTIRVWRAADGLLKHTLTDHTDRVVSVAVSPDDQYIASGSYDKTVRVWNISDGSLVRTLPAHGDYGHSDAVLSVTFSPDGQYIVSASADNSVKVWNAVGGSLVRTIPAHDGGWAWSVDVTPDGDYIVSSGGDHTIKASRMSDGSLVRTLSAPRAFRTVVSPDGEHIVSGSDDGLIRIWRFSDGALLSTTAGADGDGHTDWVFTLDVSPDGNYIVSGSRDNSIKVWRTVDGALLHTLTGADGGHTDMVMSVVVTPDGRRVVSGSGDSTIRMWRSED